MFSAPAKSGETIRRVSEINPDESLQPKPDQWNDLAERYDYIRQHTEILKKLGIKE